MPQNLKLDIMKITIANIPNLRKMWEFKVGDCPFTAWVTPDNKDYYLAPKHLDLRVPQFGVRVKAYKIDYILLGQLKAAAETK